MGLEVKLTPAFVIIIVNRREETGGYIHVATGWFVSSLNECIIDELPFVFTWGIFSFFLKHLCLSKAEICKESNILNSVADQGTVCSIKKTKNRKHYKRRSY